MKSFFVFLWRYIIPILWLIFMLAEIRGGVRSDPRSQILVLPPGETIPHPWTPYPWEEIIFIGVVTGIESAFLYLVLSPNGFSFLHRVSFAFAIFYALSILVNNPVIADAPVSAPSVFTLLSTWLLFLLLIITVTVVFLKYIIKKVAGR